MYPLPPLTLLAALIPEQQIKSDTSASLHSWNLSGSASQDVIRNYWQTIVPYRDGTANDQC